MLERDPLDALYATIALFFQIVLIVHFAVRKWFPDKTIQLWGMDLMRYQIERTQTE